MGIEFSGPRALLATEGYYGNRLTGAETNPRQFATQQTTMSTGVLRVAYFTQPTTVVVNTVVWVQGSTAAGATPTLIRFGLWTADTAGALLALVASTANDTTLLAGSSNAEGTKALSASYTMVAGQRYGLGLLVVTGATAPAILGGLAGNNNTTAARVPRLAGVVIGRTDLPASVASGSLTGTVAIPWIGLVP